MKKNITWDIRHLVDNSFVPPSQQTCVIYQRLTGISFHIRPHFNHCDAAYHQDSNCTAGMNSLFPLEVPYAYYAPGFPLLFLLSWFWILFFLSITKVLICCLHCYIFKGMFDKLFQGGNVRRVFLLCKSTQFLFFKKGKRL